MKGKQMEERKSDAMDKKNSFIMYLDYEEHFNLLSDKEIGILMRGIFQYVRTGKDPDFCNNAALKIAFSFVKTNIDIDSRKYKKKCEKNREIAENRWRQQKAKFNGCHLGNISKCDSCFGCLKKYICTLPESSSFKLNHHDKSFEEWNKEVEQLYDSWCEERRKNGESTDLEFFDYNWLEDSEHD